MTTTAEVLASGSIEVIGRLAEASNATLRCRADLDGVVVDCVYKPRRGERPLWDFTEGTLGQREVATYVMSTLLDLSCVPMTVWRTEGPFGEGMCQQWIDETDEAVVDLVRPDAVPEGWKRILDGEDYEGEPVTLAHADRADLREVALLDAVVNNTDRKGGHVLVAPGSRVMGIDHGVTFHTEDKLRTVLWGWATEPLTEAERHRLHSAQQLVSAGALDDWLATREVDATLKRMDSLLATSRMPVPDGSWPPLPWPAF